MIICFIGILQKEHHIIVWDSRWLEKPERFTNYWKIEEFSNYKIIFPYSYAIENIEKLHEFTDPHNKNILLLDDIDEYLKEGKTVQ